MLYLKFLLSLGGIVVACQIVIWSAITLELYTAKEEGATNIVYFLVLTIAVTRGFTSFVCLAKFRHWWILQKKKKNRIWWHTLRVQHKYCYTNSCYFVSFFVFLFFFLAERYQYSFWNIYFFLIWKKIKEKEQLVGWVVWKQTFSLDS